MWLLCIIFDLQYESPKGQKVNRIIPQTDIWYSCYFSQFFVSQKAELSVSYSFNELLCAEFSDICLIFSVYFSKVPCSSAQFLLYNSKFFIYWSTFIQLCIYIVNFREALLKNKQQQLHISCLLHNPFKILDNFKHVHNMS